LRTCYAQAKVDRSPLVEDDPPTGFVDRFGDAVLSDTFIALLRRVQLRCRTSRLRNCGLVASRSAAAAADPTHVAGGTAAAAAGPAAGSAAAAVAVAADAAGGAVVVVEDDTTADSDAEDDPEPINRRPVGGEQEEGDEPGGPGAEGVAEDVLGEGGGPMGLSLTKLEFDGPSGRSTHVAGLQEGGGCCKLELSLGKLNGVITMTLTVTYFKPPQPEPEAPLAGADAGQPPPAKRKAKSKKEEEERSLALQCRLGVIGVLQVMQLAGGLVFDLCMQLPLCQTKWVLTTLHSCHAYHVYLLTTYLTLQLTILLTLE
jgi:hypothetical protein